jgi:hypothetical protein
MSAKREKGREKSFPAAGQGCKKFRGAQWPLCISRPGGGLSRGFKDKPLVRMENK